MTSRERLIAAARRGAVDRKPVICWPTVDEASDAFIISLAGRETNGQDARATGKIVLAEILNPFGRALAKGIDLNQALKDDPDAGGKLLDSLAEETQREIDHAFSKSVDGVLYLLYGAQEKHCTPMQYGGYYLERDRELLGCIEDVPFNLLFVVGEQDVYLDFVSDLPCHAFGWDSKASKITPDAVREMRKGLLAAEHESADILLRSGVENISQSLDFMGAS